MAKVSSSAGFDLGADLDLRLVRYFTVLAEHLNFGRAAAALHLGQPSLSRQIQRLEDHLGVRLLDRTPQGCRLTEAGEAFLPRAHALLRSAQQAAVVARDAAPRRSITIGHVGDFVITSAVRDLRRRHPDAHVRTRHLNWDNAHAALSDRRVDALVARAPFPFSADRLCVTVLYDEPRVLVVPASHRLAGRQSVTLDDFIEEPLVRYPGPATPWSAFWRLEPRPNGRPAPNGPLVESLEDKLEHVADGQAVAILPAGDRLSTLRQDLAIVPIEGIDPCQVVVATRANERDHLLIDFRESARTHLSANTQRTSSG